MNMMMKFINIKILISLILLCGSCSESPTQFIEFSNPGILLVSDFSETIYEDYHRGLTIVDANGNNRLNVYQNLDFYLWHPSFSQDGNRIVFAMELDTLDENALFTINNDGSNLKQISKGFNNLQEPQFLPDDIHVVYLTRTAERNWEIRIINTITMEDKLVCNGYFYGLSPEITADGEWLIFWENGDLYRIHPINRTKFKITEGNVFGERFNLNKQNNEIVFRSINFDVPSEMNIAKINIDGSNYIRYNFEGQFPRISDDGNFILYLAAGNNTPSVWLYDIDVNKTQIITSYNTWDEYVDFSPTGDKILFVREVNDNRLLFSCKFNGADLKEISDISDFSFQYPQFKP